MRFLLISGSTRAASTNTAVLRTAAQLVLPDTDVVLYPDLAALPAFNPDDDVEPLPGPVAALRAELARCDAVLFSTPEYAGALPGSFKNLLDWTVGGSQMPGLPVGWINVASIAAPTGGAGAHTELATVLGYVGAAVVADACVRAPMSRAAVTAAGLVDDAEVRRQLGAALAALRTAVLGATAATPPD
jgi:chromate reductase